MLQNRIDYIAGVNKFIDDSKSVLNEALNILGWETNETNCIDSQGYKLGSCQYDPGHKMPESSVEKHAIKCSLHKNGYALDDKFLPPAAESEINAITIDEKLQYHILKSCSRSDDNTAAHSESHPCSLRPVPQTSDRLVSDLTTSERLAIYDYVVKHTSANSEATGVDVNLPFSTTQDSTKPKTLEELLAAERDAKRRRIKYKSKNVHTSKKTHTEIIREVIQCQMEGYEEWLNQHGNRHASPAIKTEPEPSKHCLDTAKNKSSNVKEIIRNWEEWNYCYNTNPHTRYITVLNEVRDAEKKSKSKIENKRMSRRDDPSNDSKHKIKRLQDEDSHKYKRKDFHESHSRRDRWDQSTDDYNRDQNYFKVNDRNKQYHNKYGNSEFKWRDRSRSHDRSYGKYIHEVYNNEDPEESHSSRYPSSSIKPKNKSDDNQRRHKKSKKHKHKKHKHDKKKHKHKSKKDNCSSEETDSNASDSYTQYKTAIK